jgi:hypothetical protein
LTTPKKIKKEDKKEDFPQAFFCILKICFSTEFNVINRLREIAPRKGMKGRIFKVGEGKTRKRKSPENSGLRYA